ncbi:MAG TPA: hypothetical protein VIZ31_12975 [Vicinamibacteria bacterium]
MRLGGRVVAALLLVALLLGANTGAGPASGTSAAPGGSEALAAELRRLYATPGSPGERWGRRPPEVDLPDGRRVGRDEAYRDRPDFVAAAGRLLRQAGEDAVLGAWLLGSAPAESTSAASSALLEALRAADPRVRYEAGRQLGLMARSGRTLGTEARSVLRNLEEQGEPAESGVARWALERRAGPSEAKLAQGFCRGVNWWHEEDRGDAGEASFRRLAELGVDWVSIHTWDPLQRGVDSPDWAEPRRPLVIPNLKDLVRNAHAVGIKVMVKPHLEMRGYEPTDEERRVLRGPDEAARQKLYARIRADWEARPRVWHNDIEMKTESDWRAWFSRYEAYVLSYVDQAVAAGADAFCVGRETDKAAIAREGDWRRLIRQVRDRFRGPLTYSANFDGYQRIPFWDALDVVGISAYFPLSTAGAPSSEELAAGWERIMAPLESFARRQNRRVVFTEVGYPALATAAQRPWEENAGAADVWLQSRLYEAALQAVAKRPFLAGSFFWLWEGTSRPPFRDSSFSIQDKPAAFVMARWYGGRKE